MEEINLFDDICEEVKEEKQICKYCGRELSNGYDFCVYCGKNLVHDYDSYLEKAGIKNEKKKNVINLKKKFGMNKVCFLSSVVFFGIALIFLIFALINHLTLGETSYANAFGSYGGVDLKAVTDVVSGYLCTLIFIFAGYIVLRINKNK